MKKIVSILLAALLFCFAALAEPAAEALVSLEGHVLEVTDAGYLISTVEHGEVQVLVSDETYVEAMRDIIPGDYLYIDYSGMMTRSLPPQITASVVRMYVLDGGIIELYPEENAVLMNTDTHGEVYVTLPENWLGQEITAERLTVYFNGAMTMSIPPRINAGSAVPVYSLQGSVTEIHEDSLLLGEADEAVQVNIDASLLPEDLKTGDIIRIYYNGMMTRSLPPQITASGIVQISR